MEVVTKVRSNTRRERTREAILQAGRYLFGRSSLDGVSIDDIIRTAAVSKQSFYNHFTDRTELAREVMHLTRVDLEARVSDANKQESDPACRVARGMSVYARSAIDNPSEARLIARLLMEDMPFDMELNHGVVGDVEAGLEQGRLAVFTLETGVGFIVGVTQSLVSRILLDHGASAAVSITQQVVTLTLRALGLPPIEAELISAQAADRIVRRGDFSGCPSPTHEPVAVYLGTNQ
jgi:AcrR family transcriptional regulator